MNKETIFIAILRVDIYEGSYFLGNADFHNHYFVTAVVEKSGGHLTDESRQVIAQLAKEHTYDPWDQPHKLGDYPQGRVCNTKAEIIEAQVSA